MDHYTFYRRETLTHWNFFLDIVPNAVIFFHLKVKLISEEEISIWLFSIKKFRKNMVVIRANLFIY